MGYEGRSDEGRSNGGADGVIMAIAIAVVLFFVIRIYSDYALMHRSPGYTRHKKVDSASTSPEDRRGSGEPGSRTPSRRPEPLFDSSRPYPSSLTDVQVGDRLSELFNADLPGARRDHNIFSFHPSAGPFKTVTCMLEGGANDPPVVGITYIYRSRNAYEAVRREALNTFGDAETVATEQGNALRWNGIDHCTVVLAPDRFSVEKEWQHDAGYSNERPRDETFR